MKRRALPALVPVTVAPPAELAWLAAIVGRDGAFRLVEECGGQRIYLPAKPGRSKLAKLVGAHGAAELVEHLGGLRMFKVPSAKRWRVLVYRQAGASYGEIARKVGLDESSVARYLQRAGATRQQPELPGLL